MKDRLHLIYGTDATIQDLFRLGMGSWLKSMITAYDHEFEITLYSWDHKDYSADLGVLHRPLGLSFPFPRPARQLAFYVGLLRRARGMKGLIRVLSPNLGILPELKRLSHASTIVDFHYDWAPTARRHYGGLKGLLAGPFQNRCIRSADLVIGTTPALTRRIRNRYGKRSLTIPNFVDTDLFRPMEPREEKIVFAGRLHWAKGVGTLMEAFSAIADRHRECKLVIMGVGEAEAELRGRVPPGLEGRIEFAGSRPQEDVARELGSARVSALPTLTSEGNPKALVEAMSAGTPLVGSSVPGIMDLLEDGRTGLLVHPGDAVSLAAALSRLLEDRPLWQRISRECLKTSRRFSKGRILRHQARVMRICARRRQEVRMQNRR